MTFARYWTTADIQDGRDGLPALALTAWQTNNTLALDGNKGGSYTPASLIEILNGGFAATVKGPWIYSGNSAVREFRTYTAGAGDGQTFSPNFDMYELTGGVGQLDHYMSAAGWVGRMIWFKRDATGAQDIVIHRQGEAAAIVTLTGGNFAAATVFDDGTNWRLLRYCANCTPGAHA